MRRPHELAPPTTRVAIVSARWHADLVQQARDAARASLAFAPGERPVDVETHEVPGALEIPLFAQRLARTGRHDAVIAIAFVVDGGIYRHEFVAQTVIEGLMRVQLETGVPVFSCVLTPQAFHEHEVHRRFFAEHMAAKGREVAEACLGMLEALHGLERAERPIV
jgi:6,7-dimethyl-8-ribityllumazine synthase